MTKKWPYALVALGGLALGGVTCGSGGYLLGYYKSEPEIFTMDYEKDGIEGLCVYKNNKEMICAADVNEDGAVDVVTIDVKTQQIIEEKSVSGKDDCVNKYLRRLQEEMQKQQQEEPQEL